MTPDKWKQVLELFEAALELAPGERAAFLGEACRGDSSLRGEVEALLSADNKAEGFLDGRLEAATALFGDGEAPLVEGAMIGAYRIVRELGRGGMGTVYLAGRADDTYKKRVAIKLIKRGMDTEEVLSRFRNERQILASLDHPNIARLFDGGTTDQGLPYFVMEYIEGQPIDRYCDERKLTTAERLQLFRTVCAAAHYAHQNLVVHRDLKPSNILVTNEGAVKLLDFGIAKLLNPDLYARTDVATAQWVRPMTPDYASPEQARGLKITTASDTYSLGVILYELLTGRRPYRITSYTPQEIERVICEQEPEKPSTAVHRVETVPSPDGETQIALSPEKVSRTREGQPEKLRRKLAGDLDNIVLMAMRKESQRRYASVEQLAEDLRRHLEGLPVIARKDTFAYRASKFVKRHKAGVVAAALIVVILLAGVIVTLWQASVARSQRAIAERRFNDVRNLANSLVFRLHDEIADLPGSTRARQTLVQMALEYLDALAKEAGGDASLQAELASAYEKVGDVQGNPSNANLGDIQGALASYQKAQAIRETLVQRNLTDRKMRGELARNQVFVSDLLSQMGDTAAGLESQQRTLSVFQSLVEEDPRDVDARDGLGNSENRMGYLLLTMGKADEALEHQRKSAAIRKLLAAENPNEVKFQRNLAVSYLWLALTLGELNDSQGAIVSWRQAIAGFEAIATANPTSARSRRDVQSSYNGLGDALMKAGDLDSALESQLKALSHSEESYASDKNNAVILEDVSYSLKQIGGILVEKGDVAGALKIYRRALDIYEKRIAEDRMNTMYSAFAAEIHNGMGNAMMKANDLSEAMKSYRRALAIFEKLSSEDPAEAMKRRELARSCSNLGNVYAILASKSPGNQRIENWREARSNYQKSLDILLDMRNRGTLPAVESGEPEKIAAEIARCDAALKGNATGQ
ncbi:MAG: serine/threonine-protein kinase [Acidobacteriota bacterium]